MNLFCFVLFTFSTHGNGFDFFDSFDDFPACSFGFDAGSLPPLRNASMLSELIIFYLLTFDARFFSLSPRSFEEEAKPHFLARKEEILMIR